MGVPADHAALLSRHDFPVPAGAALAPAERALLAKYGHWLDALASGLVAPVSPEQERFVRSARGEAEPHSVFETAWAKLQAAGEDVPPRGPAELAGLMERLQAARAEAARLDAEHERRREELLATLKPQLDALEAEYGPRKATAADEAAALEADVRAAALEVGGKFEHAGVRASVQPGRVAWDTASLDLYGAAHPEIAAFRKVGKPFVILRFAEKNLPPPAPPP